MNFIFNFYRYGTDTREQDRGKERDFIPEVHSGEARPHSVGRALGILRIRKDYILGNEQVTDYVRCYANAVLPLPCVCQIIPLLTP